MNIECNLLSLIKSFKNVIYLLLFVYVFVSILFLEFNIIILSYNMKKICLGVIIINKRLLERFKASIFNCYSIILPME